MILWTCRVEEHLKEAVDWCGKFGLEFDAVNDNLPENIEKYGNNPRKVYATCYIDDLAVDKNKYDLPFHTDEKIDYSKFDKYPLGSEWMLKTEYAELPVMIERGKCYLRVHRVRGVRAKRINLDISKIRRDIEWFYDKLFPKE